MTLFLKILTKLAIFACSMTFGFQPLQQPFQVTSVIFNFICLIHIDRYVEILSLLDINILPVYGCKYLLSQKISKPFVSFPFTGFFLIFIHLFNKCNHIYSFIFLPCAYLSSSMVLKVVYIHAETQTHSLNFLFTFKYLIYLRLTFVCSVR